MHEKDTRRRDLAASAMFDKDDSEHEQGGEDLSAAANDETEKKNPRDGGEDLSASIVLEARSAGKLNSDEEDREHDSAEVSPRTPGTPVAVRESSSKDDTPHPSTGEFLSRGTLTAQTKQSPQPKTAAANSPWWASYPLTMIMLFASFGAGLNLMLSYMSGRTNNVWKDVNFNVYGNEVTNAMLYVGSLAAKTSLDIYYHHNPLRSLGSSIITTGIGVVTGVSAAFGYKEATNQNLPRAEVLLKQAGGFVADLAELGFNGMGKSGGMGRN